MQYIICFAVFLLNFHEKNCQQVLNRATKFDGDRSSRGGNFYYPYHNLLFEEDNANLRNSPYVKTYYNVYNALKLYEKGSDFVAFQNKIYPVFGRIEAFNVENDLKKSQLELQKAEKLTGFKRPEGEERDADFEAFRKSVINLSSATEKVILVQLTEFYDYKKSFENENTLEEWIFSPVVETVQMVKYIFEDYVCAKGTMKRFLREYSCDETKEQNDQFGKLVFAAANQMKKYTATVFDTKFVKTLTDLSDKLAAKIGTDLDSNDSKTITAVASIIHRRPQTFDDELEKAILSGYNDLAQPYEGQSEAFQQCIVMTLNSVQDEALRQALLYRKCKNLEFSKRALGLGVFIQGKLAEARVLMCLVDLVHGILTIRYKKGRSTMFPTLINSLP